MRATVQPKQLGKHKTGWTRPKKQDTRALLWRDLVQAVRSARGRLHECSINIGEILDGEDFAGGVGAVLGEGTGQGDTVGFEVLAEQ